MLTGGGINADTAVITSKTPLVIVRAASRSDIPSTEANFDTALRTRPVLSALLANLSKFAIP